MFHGRPGFARAAAIAAIGASSLAAAACGGPTASALSAAPSASATADPLAHLTGYQVATQAMANLKAATSLTVVGTVTQSGQASTLNLRLKPGKGCSGTVEDGTTGAIKLVVIGSTVYFNPDDKFWKANAGSDASAVTALIDGRYIKTTTSASGMADIASVCDLSHSIASNTLDGNSKGVAKEPVTTLNGVRVLPLKASDGTLYVTDTSKPQLVEVYSPKGAPDGAGKVDFQVGVPVTLTPPPAAQVIDGSKVGL
jgi:hypothetical protein